VEAQSKESFASRAAAAAQVFVEDPASPVLSPKDVHHLARVLRLRAGERVVASDGRGAWAECIVAVPPGSGAVVLERTSSVCMEEPATPTLLVAFSLVKAARPEWIVQKLTELGIDVIVPIETDRCVARWRSGAFERIERLRRIALEAAAQCRRVWLPEIRGVATLEDLMSYPEALALAHHDGVAPSLSFPAVAVGPEGGWSPRELDLGLPRVRLGTPVLRAETAAITAGALLAALRSGVVEEARAPVSSGPDRHARRL